MAQNVSNEEVGIRSFHLRRDMAVEQGIDKIRQKLGADWQKLSFNDTQTLHWALGETWSFVARTSWSRIYFSMLDINDVKNILKIAEDIINHKKIGSIGLDEIYKILEAKKLPDDSKI